MQVHRNTAFLWRHKILDALQNMADDVTLDGIIEADETFSPSRTRAIIARVRHLLCHAKAHKRGHSTHIRGLSQERYVFLVLINRNGLSISRLRILVEFLQRDLHHIYDGRIKTNSSSCYGQDELLCRVTNANGIDLVQLKRLAKPKKGIYNIQHINSYIAS